MNRRTKTLLVLAVFAVIGTAAAAEQFLIVAHTTKLPPPVKSAKSVDAVFWSSFRYYLAWALVTPGVFWLSRRLPLLQRRWWWAVLAHLAIPVAASVPFFAFRLLVNALLTATPYPFEALSVLWRRILTVDSTAIAPTYWALVAVGTMVAFARDDAARRLRAVELHRSLSTAQLDALRTQLQPHFLFNTLNAIGSLAQAGETDAVVRVVDHLGTLLRLSMESSGRQCVPLADETRMLDAYLAIEEVRFGDRLRVARRIDAQAAQAFVPALILQPLVENALAHGIGGRIEGGTVEIAARRDGRWLEVAVRDDGAGLPEGWSWRTGAGRGLANVRDRLAALYGVAASFGIEPADGRGTVARLRIPWTTQPAEAGGSAPWNA